MVAILLNMAYLPEYAQEAFSFVRRHSPGLIMVASFWLQSLLPVLYLKLQPIRVVSHVRHCNPTIQTRTAEDWEHS